MFSLNVLVSFRCQGLKEELKLKEDENGRLQDEIDEKENEIEVCELF